MNEYLAGGISGIAQVIVGYPLDTIKILHQNNMRVSIKECLNYKGARYPLNVSLISNTLVLGLSNNLKKTNDNMFMNGSISGFLLSPFVYVFDIKKINIQANKNNKIYDYIFKYRCIGLPMTISRETIGYGIYMYIYNKMKDNNYNTFISGGVAGVCNWTITYPIDVIKNRQLANKTSIKKSYNMGHFMKGYKYCLLRGFIVNSIVLSSYEYIMKNI